MTDIGLEKDFLPDVQTEWYSKISITLLRTIFFALLTYMN